MKLTTGGLLAILFLTFQGVESYALDWTNSFLFRTTGGFGFENPMIRVAFGLRDYPPDPVMPTLVDLSEPTMLTLTIPDISVTNGEAQILFAVEEDFSINATGTPEDGLFEFETFGQGVQNFLFDMSTGSGGIPIPGTWVAFNPQPEPPASFHGMGFHFDFSSNSPATLVIQALDDGVEPYSFELIQSADFDHDGDVDGNDFLMWQRGGSPNGINGGDLGLWQSQFGSPLTATGSAVPEPKVGWILLTGVVGVFPICLRESRASKTNSGASR